MQSLITTFQRWRTLQTHHISSLPIAILMPHSACNCRCVMCDIWKDNKNLKQLSESDVKTLLITFKKLNTKQVLMSGGEALLNPNFFRFCEILNQEKIEVVLLSTGLTLKNHAADLVKYVKEIIVSLDGDEEIHNAIRNIPDAFQKLKQGIEVIRSLQPSFKITGRCVIHQLNFMKWKEIVLASKSLKLQQISFLPADISSQAFNRDTPWSPERAFEIMIGKEQLLSLYQITEALINDFAKDFASGYIAESPQKIRMIYAHYAALNGLGEFPYKQCNAPWVSTVVEADGTVRPCFFHEAMGNIHNSSLEDILNSPEAVQFRRTLDIHRNETCKKCVCYLNLNPTTKV